MEREQAALIEQERQQRQQDEAELRLGKGTTPEQRAEFLARVKRREAELQERVARALAGYMTPREQFFQRLLYGFWRDVQWMLDGNLGFSGQFPNGKPLWQQSPWQVAVWTLFIGAIRERAYGSDDNDDNDAPARGDPNDPTEQTLRQR